MSIRTLIVDDEAAARSRLRKVLAPFERLDIIDEARDGVEAVERIVRLAPDLIFLDVQMPGLDGFEVLRSLPVEHKWPLVIFATAYDEYALEAFDANAVAYLLKPVNRDKLRVAVERAERLVASADDLAVAHLQLRSVVRSTQHELQHVVARLRDRYLMVPIDEVCFFRVEDGVVKVKTDSNLYRTDYNLVDLEARLPNPPFLRVHRSIIVNGRRIAEVAPMFKGTYMLVMNDRERSEIQVSERQSKLVRELLQLRPPSE